MDQAFYRLATYGVDYESFEFLKAHFEEYLKREKEMFKERSRFLDLAFPYGWESSAMPERKDFVFHIKDILAADLTFDPAWFGIAMFLYDRRAADAEIKSYATFVLDVPFNTIKNQWLKGHTPELDFLNYGTT